MPGNQLPLQAVLHQCLADLVTEARASGLGDWEAGFTLSPGLLHWAQGGDLFGDTPSLAALRFLAPIPSLIWVLSSPSP